MPPRDISSFSPCGELFVCSNDDGILTLWETSSNCIKQEFNLKSLSNTTCSCLIWASLHNTSISEEKVQIFIIGTDEGGIFMYDYCSGNLYHHFVAGHSEEVNDLSLDLETNCLFSCSSDKWVIVWNIKTGQIKQKWIASKEKIYSICVIDSNNLLTGSDQILWWNVEEKTIIKTITYSKYPVISLNVVKSLNVPPCSYIISASNKETEICAWSLNENKKVMHSKKKEKAAASFLLPSHPQHTDVSKSFSKENPLHLAVVTNRGTLLLFEHVLNGKTKDLLPQMTLQIKSKPVKTDDKAVPIPIIASKLLDAAESCIIAYGSKESPVFEPVNIFDCPKHLILTRDEPIHKKAFDTPQLKVKWSNTFCDNKTANGQTSPVSSPQNSCKKKKSGDVDTENLHLSQTEAIISLNESSIKSRISPPSTPSVKKKKSETAEYLSESSVESCSPPSSPCVKKKKSEAIESLNESSVESRISPPSSPCVKKKKSFKKQLDEINFLKEDIEKPVETDPSKMLDCLLRGIEETRSNLINMVLYCDNSELVKSIVKNIPLQSLNSILIELHRRLILQEKRYSSSLIKWLKEILDYHLSYIITCQDLTSILNKLIELLDASNISQTLLKMHMLRGLLRIQLQNLSEEESSSSESDSENEMVT